METLIGRWGPKEIAWGVAGGLALGLVPKTNLVAVFLALAVFLSYANLLVGVVMAVVVSLAAPWVHPIAHEIGVVVLTSNIGQQGGAAIFRIPFVPWTFLDNTVVLGSTLIGLALLLPVFCIVWVAARLAGFGTKKEKELESGPGPAVSKR